ncbi:MULTISPECIES: GntR family transcriptional regulator [Cellulomonas]|uniref:GntR family transcriptional regulator n=1 Tax=Cellulomonas TaxID=1707 RepID=UPI0010A83E13|nr:MULTISPECIES: GntR family transcriptional regulator [Cellulomonas]
MSVQLEVDLDSGVPVYEQVRAQVVAHVAAGRLRPGDRLPTIRALATDLGVAPGTVARAFRELEAGGVVVTRRRAGTLVAAGVAPADAAPHAAAVAYAEAARAAGLTPEEALDLVRGVLLAPPGAPATAAR